MYMYFYITIYRLYIHIIVLFRSPEVYTVLASEDASEGEDIDGDYVGEMLDLYKESAIETQSIEKHDV